MKNPQKPFFWASFKTGMKNESLSLVTEIKVRNFFNASPKKGKGYSKNKLTYV